MSGALLTLGSESVPAALAVGTELSLRLSSEGGPTPVSVDARVVRRTAPPEPPGIGVAFVNVDAAAGQRIESMMLHVVSGIDDAFEP